MPGQHYEDFSADCHGQGGPGFIIWGDSHAASLHMGLFALGGSAVHSQFTAAACPPILDYMSSTNRTCMSLNRDIFSYLVLANTKGVIMSADWRYHSSMNGWFDNLRATVEQLEKNGVSVYLVGSLPQWRPSLPVLVAKDMRSRGLSLDRLPSQYPLRDWELLSELDADLSALALAAGATFIPPMADLCRQNLCDALISNSDGRGLMAWDRSHLTLEGSLYVGKRLVARLNGNK